MFQQGIDPDNDPEADTVQVGIDKSASESSLRHFACIKMGGPFIAL
jgi:hypothetical protein